MRKLLYLVVAAGLAVATTVALASASRMTPGNASVTPAQETANAYLPAGETPITDNWYSGGGDLAQTTFSQLKQINSTNIGGLKLVWDRPLQLNGPAVGSLQQAPICCPDGLLMEQLRAGTIAVNPADGTTAWQYSGVKYDTVRGSTTQHVAARGISYFPKLDLVYTGQEDGSIVALKAKTGAPVWTAQVSGAGTYGSATGAESEPFTVVYDDGADGIVISAPNGGESPFRGHVDAYNAKTGALIWRSWTTPDPTQLPYILSWANPAEASQGGAAVWSIPSVNTQLGLVYYSTGNVYPWTGTQAGDHLWTASIVAVDWKTGALRWFFQQLKHEIWDDDSPQPVTTFNVPIDGKMTPVVAEGNKGGYMYVLNGKNGSFLPHFNFAKVPTFDLTGRGIKLNNLSAFQWVPQGPVGCVAPQDLTLAGIQRCAAMTDSTLVPASRASGPGATSTGNASLFPSDYVQIAYGGAAPKPGTPGSYGPGVQGQNGTDPCPTCKVVNFLDGQTIVGTTFAAASTSDMWVAWGGRSPFNYPMKSYDPITHSMYFCARVGQNSAKGNQGSFAQGNESTNINYLAASQSDPRLFTASFEALNMTNNTFLWQYGSKTSTFGSCNAGTMTTAGNLAFTSFAGRNDMSAAQLVSNGLTPGGATVAFDATTGHVLWQWGYPGGTVASHPITFMYKGKQYIAVYHSVPGPNDLPGGIGARSDGGREAMAVFSL
jgi:putative pyrroloquinoline-quinone binding quinoprotein